MIDKSNPDNARPDTKVSPEEALRLGMKVLGLCSNEYNAPSPHEIRRLCEMGAELDAVHDSRGWTPLHHAARKGYHEAVAILLEFQADAYVLNNEKCTPVDIAQGECAKLLEKQRMEYRNDHWRWQSEQKWKRATGYWQRSGENTIAEVEEHDNLHLRISDIFNFARMERMTVTHKKDGEPCQTTSPQPFEDVPRPVLARAAEAFKKAGGTVPDAVEGLIGSAPVRLDKKIAPDNNRLAQ